MAAEWQNTIHPRKVQQCEHTLLVLELVNLDIFLIATFTQHYPLCRKFEVKIISISPLSRHCSAQS